MSKMFNSIDLNSLVQREPQEIKSLIDQFVSGENVFPENFNWLGLAELSGSMAREKADLSSFNLSCSWAEISICIYEILANLSTNLSEKFAFEESSMFLRANLIKKFGAKENDFVLDQNEILNWFHRNLGFMTIQEFKEEILIANELKSRLSSVELPEEIQNYTNLVKRLRSIKRSLSIVKLIAESEKVVLSPQVSQWISVWKNIP
jgi:hypothetical protein